MGWGTKSLIEQYESRYVQILNKSSLTNYERANRIYHLGGEITRRKSLREDSDLYIMGVDCILEGSKLANKCK